MPNLYSPEQQKIMKVSVQYSSMSHNRIEEILTFAQAMNFSRIGIAHCITFAYEAKILAEYLSKHFEVFTVHCKYGRLSYRELLGGHSERVLCNPAGQAHYLNERGTELNISMGLCVGHDMIFSKNSDGLVTNLFDKDFTNNNNPAKALEEINR